MINENNFNQTNTHKKKEPFTYDILGFLRLI